jgi:hypothetical protein
LGVVIHGGMRSGAGVVKITKALAEPERGSTKAQPCTFAEKETADQGCASYPNDCPYRRVRLLTLASGLALNPNGDYGVRGSATFNFYTQTSFEIVLAEPLSAKYGVTIHNKGLAFDAEH